MQRLGKVLSLAIVAVTVAALTGCFLQSAPRAQFTTTPAYDYPPLDVTFDASASSSPNGPIVDYSWDLGDGTTAGGVIVTHTYVEKGVYEVTLEVRDSAGETGARTKSVEALNRPPVARFKTNVSTTGVRQPIWFNASESTDSDGEIVDYLWDFGDGTTDEGVLVEHEYQSAGGTGWRPQITLTVVDDNGGTNSVTHQVLIVGCDVCGGGGS
jgi:PKD repeat protein